MSKTGKNRLFSGYWTLSNVKPRLLFLTISAVKKLRENSGRCKVLLKKCPESLIPFQNFPFSFGQTKQNRFLHTCLRVTFRLSTPVCPCLLLNAYKKNSEHGLVCSKDTLQGFTWIEMSFSILIGQWLLCTKIAQPRSQGFSLGMRLEGWKESTAKQISIKGGLSLLWLALRLIK